MENKRKIRGVWAAVMTPFDERGEVSQTVLGQFMDFFLEKELDGIFPVSNVGEFAALTFEQRCEITKICTSMADGRLKVCPGVTDLNLDRALKLAEFAWQCKADGVVVSSPYYYPYGDAFVEEYLRVFLEESPLPVIIYHSPKFAHPVQETFLLDLLAHPKVAAIKESSGDARFLISLLETIRREQIDVQVMVGWEELLLTALVHGAAGCITSCGGIVPEILKKVYTCWEQGDLDKAAQYQQSICRITQELGSYGLPCGYKMGMAARIPHRVLQSRRMEGLRERMRAREDDISMLLERELALVEQ